MLRGMGWVPDPPKTPGEAPDFDAEEKLSTVRPTTQADLSHLIKILDQGRLGSCTMNAVAQAVRVSHLKQIVESGTMSLEVAQDTVEFLSRLFGYLFARSTHHDTGTDSGTWLRACFGVLNKFGFAPESVWPYDDNPDPGSGKFTRTPSMRAVRAAYDQHQPTEYRRILVTGYDRIDYIKRALAAKHVVCFGTDISERFCQGDIDDGQAIKPPVGEKIAGGHAMCIASFSGDTFGVPNSWGERWGIKGWSNFSADYLAWEESRDFWIVEGAPKFSEGGYV